MMQELRFRVDLNPFGINYNPSSLSRNLWALLNGKKVYQKRPASRPMRNGSVLIITASFQPVDPDACLENINDRIRLLQRPDVGHRLSVAYLGHGLGICTEGISHRGIQLSQAAI